MGKKAEDGKGMGLSCCETSDGSELTRMRGFAEQTDLGAGSAEATTFCDEVPPPHRPLKVITALAVIAVLPLEAPHLL